MALYKARKGAMALYVQPEMIGDFAGMGYEITRMEEVPVEDVRAEAEAIRSDGRMAGAARPIRGASQDDGEKG